MITITTTRGQGILGTRIQWICSHCQLVVAEHCRPKGDPGEYERLNPKGRYAEHLLECEQAAERHARLCR